MRWFLRAMRHYADFGGRSRRREYWSFVLIYLGLGIVVAGIEATLAQTVGQPLMWLMLLFMLATLIPSLAVTVRRLHDTGRSGWWVLLNVVPLIGPVVLLVFVVTDSEPGYNRYGPSPKGLSI